jgi:hypothetical protein
MKQEMIKDLIDRASTLRMVNGVANKVVDHDKFAALLLDEVLEVVYRQRDPGTLNYKPSVKTVEDIKMHFGVEQ